MANIHNNFKFGKIKTYCDLPRVKSVRSTINQPRHLLTSVLVFIILFSSGCGAIEGIFKAGMWWGFILIFGVIALIIFIISKVFGNKN